MSGESRDQVLQHLKKAKSELGRGRYSDALLTLEKAGQLADEAQAGDVLSIVLGTTGMAMWLAGRYDEALTNHTIALKIQEELAEHEPFFNTWVATTLNNLGNLLSDMGRIDEAKARYEGALEKYERLLESDHENVVYQSYVAMTLNNLGNLLSDMGMIDDARGRYECALEMRERLLEGDSDNTMYQSDVAGTLNNLGLLLSGMGRIDDAREQYEKSLGIYTEPMQYMTIRAKSRAIINIIQLLSNSAEKETNKLKKQKYLKDIYTAYNEHKAFFTKYDLDYEHRLAREAGLGAHIRYLMLNAEAETDTDKRIDEYERCVKEMGEIAETEADEGLKGLWSSVMHYLEGRQLINEAIKSDPPEKELVEQAVEQFKRAKDIYKNANVCYCIYTVLLELESVEVLSDAAVTRLKGLLHTAIDSLPEKMDETVKSAFGEIELLLEKRTVNADPDLFTKLNRCITKIEYYVERLNTSRTVVKFQA